MIPHTQAKQALRNICGGKANNWLPISIISLDGATSLRQTILMDYIYNTHDVEGIDELALVLKYISQQIQK